MIQLTLDGTEVETAPASEADRRKAALGAAHQAVTDAEAAVLEEESRPPSLEHWGRLADRFERRAASWRRLAENIDRDRAEHTARAMELAAQGDLLRAQLLRTRLGVQR